MGNNDLEMSKDELLSVISGLSKIVRSEYPADHLITDIITTWGTKECLTSKELNAIVKLDMKTQNLTSEEFEAIKKFDTKTGI